MNKFIVWQIIETSIRHSVVQQLNTYIQQKKTHFSITTGREEGVRTREREKCINIFLCQTIVKLKCSVINNKLFNISFSFYLFKFFFAIKCFMLRGYTNISTIMGHDIAIIGHDMILHKIFFMP